MLTSDRTFELAEYSTQPDIIDDITGRITSEVLSKKGRVFFTGEDEIKELGKIALLTRYL